jgi:hypothetical protein
VTVTTPAQTESSITTYTGKYFDILNPEVYEFDINEIAVALSNLCRYTGHVNRFYSVAEHSVLVSRLVPSDLALTGLLHDASEAYLGDVSSPLKKLLPEYKAIEERVERAIADYFSIPFPYPEEIKKADKRMYWNERKSVADNGIRDGLWHQEFAAARKVDAVGLPPHLARKSFLRRYKEIMKG